MAAMALDERPMLDRLARPIMHAVHVATFAALLVTGLLLLLPDLRAATVGGYSLLIRRGHCWIGVAFVLLPLLVVVGCGIRSLRAQPEALTLRARWQALHFATTVATGAIFTLSGFAIWANAFAPEALVDASRLTHVWLTYVATALVAAHVVDAGVAAIVARVTAASAEVARQAPR